MQSWIEDVAGLVRLLSDEAAAKSKNQEYLDRLIQIHDELEKKGIIHKSGSMREA